MKLIRPRTGARHRTVAGSLSEEHRTLGTIGTVEYHQYCGDNVDHRNTDCSEGEKRPVAQINGGGGKSNIHEQTLCPVSAQCCCRHFVLFDATILFADLLTAAPLI